MAEPHRARHHLTLAVAIAVALAALVGGGVGLAIVHDRSATSTGSNPVEQTHRTIPESVAHIPLIDQKGRVTDLAAFRGRTVILADFMTSCQEECPITTGALLGVEQDLDSAHLGKKVVIVEVTVDPWRDTPSRLRAYQRRFGVHWTMLTGSLTNLHRLWSFLGVYYQRVAESKPPAINWETGRPYTFDITHSDDAFVIGREGNERAVVTGNADVEGKLSKPLADLLDAEGRHDLDHPGVGSWTPQDMLQAVGRVLGQPIPAASGV